MDATIGFVLGLVGATIDFFGNLFGGLLIFSMILGSLALVYRWGERRYGQGGAVLIMFAWLLFGLPLLLKMLDLAIQAATGP